MNENDLKKFIAFTKDLLNSIKDKQEYAWFMELYKDEIANSFFNSQSIPSIPITSKFDAITEQDIIRVKAYLNFIDKKAVNYGKEFYKNIIDNELRKSLIADFKEMKIALKNDDIIEFGRRLSLQLENIFNYSLSSLDVHTLISLNPQQYTSVIPDWQNYNGNPFNFYNSFFSFNRNTNQSEPVELSKVSFKTKSIFLSIHFNYQVNAKNINDLYFLRNIGSHRGQLNQHEIQQLNQIIKDFDKNFSYYYKVLFDVVNGIPNIK